MKLWYQVTGDFSRYTAFPDAVSEYANSVVSPGTEVTVHGMDRDINQGLSQTDVLCAPAAFHQAIVRLFLRNVRKAEAAGYDAFVVGTYAEPALRELRSLAKIPVVSAAEATLLTACTVAPRVAMIGLSLQTVPFLQASVARHRLAERVSGIYFVNDVMAETSFDECFANPGPYIEEFTRVARTAISEGADAVIPAEGMVATLVAMNGLRVIDDVPVIDGVGVPVIAAEAAVAMRKRLGLEQSRRIAYRRPSEEALKLLFDNL